MINFFLPLETVLTGKDVFELVTNSIDSSIFVYIILIDINIKIEKNEGIYIKCMFNGKKTSFIFSTLPTLLFLKLNL